MDENLSWVEIDREALEQNIAVFRSLVGEARRLLVVVKGNAYGHGMLPVANIALAAGADWLGVFNMQEAIELRQANIASPILVMGPTPENLLVRAAQLRLSITVASPEAAEAVLRVRPKSLRVHLKLETGTNRQGFLPEHLPVIQRLAEEPSIEIEGAYTHFADIEDTTDHSFAETQLRRFQDFTELLLKLDVTPPLLHTACSAATLLFPQTLFAMARVGISAYGLWPSKETYVSAHQVGREPAKLKPVLSWKTRVSQVKELAVGEYVGYGRTFRTTRPTRIAVLPLGYADGYDRGLSNRAHVLIAGRRAPLRGRVCMNLMMADVTDIPEAKAGDEVVLIGAQGDEHIHADHLASWLGTINYEIVTRIASAAPRIVVPTDREAA
ncbi:MAG: alanine racemase [Myxococcales bacterium]|nr:MAG: alanine racemase [Myxococcales bacterium]